MKKESGVQNSQKIISKIDNKHLALVSPAVWVENLQLGESRWPKIVTEIEELLELEQLQSLELYVLDLREVMFLFSVIWNKSRGIQLYQEVTGINLVMQFDLGIYYSQMWGQKSI